MVTGLVCPLCGLGIHAETDESLVGGAAICRLVDPDFHAYGRTQYTQGQLQKVNQPLPVAVHAPRASSARGGRQANCRLPALGC